MTITEDGTIWTVDLSALTDNPSDTDIALTSLGDFTVISSETEVHGALDDLDSAIAAISAAPGDLQAAYDLGNVVNVAPSSPITVNATGALNRGMDITVGAAKAMRLENNSSSDDAATIHAYNASGDGTAFYCSGSFRLSGDTDVRVYSNSGLHWQLDRGGDAGRNDSLTVRDHDDLTVFSVKEDGSAHHHGYLDMHSNTIQNVLEATTTGQAMPYDQTAGGDLSGNLPNPTVSGLQGISIASTSPLSGQVLRFDGANWTPGDDDSGTDDQTLDEVYGEAGNTVTMDAGDILFQTGSPVLFIDDDIQVGIGNSAPLTRLDIRDGSRNGAIRIGNTAEADTGIIKFDGTNFLGHDGTEWKSLSLEEDMDWTKTDSVLWTQRLWGISKLGNTLYGAMKHSHINLGWNSITGNPAGDDTSATVAGGYLNTASERFTTVGGGKWNTAGNSFAVVSGGQSNNANNIWASICGGVANTAGGGRSFIGGGQQNWATGAYSTVGCGYFNMATGTYSAIPGGASCSAAGDYSFAFGNTATTDIDNTAVFNWNGADGTVFIETNSLTTAYELYVAGDAYATVSWDSSDRLLKKNIRDVSSGLNIVSRLRPVSFQWRKDILPNVSGTGSYGFIAQELREILPELVSVANGDNGQLAVNYNGIIPINTAAIQELTVKSDEQDERIESLERQIEELRRQNDELRQLILQNQR